MKTRGRAMLLAALLATAAAATVATARTGPRLRTTGPGAIKNVLLAIPNLTAEQKKRIAALTNVAKMRSAPLRQQLFTARRELARVWAADQLDPQLITRKEADVGIAAGKAKAIWSDFFVQLHDVLTPPQRTWLALHGAGLYGAAEGIPDFSMSTGPYCPCAEQTL